MKFKTSLKHSHALIDLTPLVDVVLLMLVFFIVTSDILPLKSLAIQNPTLPREAPPLTTQLVVVMDAQQVIYVGSKKSIVDFSSLKEHLQGEVEKLKHQGGDPTIVISADKRVDYGSFLRLFAIAQECGCRLRLVYQPEEAFDHAET